MNRFQEDVFQNIYDYLDHFDLNQCDEEERLDIVKDPWALGVTIESVFLRDIEDIDAYKEAERLRYGMEPYNDPKKAKAYVKENLYDILDFYFTHQDIPNIYHAMIDHALMDQQHFLYMAFNYVRKQILSDTLHSEFPHLFKESRTTPLTQEDINAVKKYFASILEEVREYGPAPESIGISVTNDLSKSCKDFISAAERLGCKRKKIEKGFAEALKEHSASL